MQPRRPTRAVVAFAIGVPAAWGVLLLFHPTGDGDEFYPVVADQVSAWVIVHVGTLFLIPLMAAVVYALLRGVEGTAARVARVALVSFVGFYAAWEALVGIGIGLLADEVNGLPAAQRAAGAAVIEGFAGSGLVRAFELIGTGSLLVALTAAGVAFRRAGAPLAVPILLVLAAIPIAWHVTPFGQAGLALFVAAVVLVVRARPASEKAVTPAVRPAPA